MNRIAIKTSFFGVIYYYATWLFIVTCLIGAVVAMIMSKSSNIEQRDSDSDEDES